MSASPLVSDNSQKASLTFYKAYGISILLNSRLTTYGLPVFLVQKLVAGHNPDNILQSRRLRTSRLQDVS
jgi:hypothetical protein